MLTPLLSRAVRRRAGRPLGPADSMLVLCALLLGCLVMVGAARAPDDAARSALPVDLPMP